MGLDYKRIGLRRAYNLASRSPDPSNQNGAVIFVDVAHSLPGDRLGAGFNNFPPGLEVTEEMVNNREKKYFYIEHAERSAIYHAAKRGNNLNGSVMYCPWFACADCARAIILSGIKKVVGHKQRMEMTADRWRKNVDDSLDMLRQCGVEVELLDVPVLGGGVSIIVNGEEWSP